MKEVQNLLTNISIISKKYEEIAKITGENFNLFRILKVEANEVRTHSAFLSVLLNPMGSHGQGDVFLKLFVNSFQFKNNFFETKSATIENEKSTGLINEDYTEGGRIDILISDNKKNHIIIENKIYASDQEKQLVRCYNHDKNADLFYLTLDGSPPSGWSTNEQLKINEHFKTLSYKNEIISWLEECKKEACSIPILRESISQYIYLLKILTNQSTNYNMKKEIRNLINEDNVDNILLLYGELNALIGEIKKSFFNYVNNYLKDKSIRINDDESIKIGFFYDSSDVFIYYKLLKNGENNGDSVKAKEFSSILKVINKSIQSNSSNFGWYRPIHFKDTQRFEYLDKKIILKMYNEENYLKEFAKEILDEADEIRNQFINDLQKRKNFSK